MTAAYRLSDRPRFALRRGPGALIGTIDSRIREGRFQRWLALVAGFSGLLSGLEVSYEHYRGSYSRPIMYTPVILSGALIVAGVWSFESKRAANTLLPAVSAATLADSLIGTYFHVRGIQRKPGGWRLPVFNITMGPPLFAPLLFGTSAYLGMVAYFLRRDDDTAGQYILPRPAHANHWVGWFSRLHENISLEQDLREGRFQKHMAAMAALSAFFSWFEALYSHYKSNFRNKMQWTPIVIGPMLIAAGAGAVKSRRVAQTWLPATSTVAMAAGVVGFGFHARGVARRPGGLRKPLYNIIYGPPVFAPLLFAASGFIGLLASLLRREK